MENLIYYSLAIVNGLQQLKQLILLDGFYLHISFLKQQLIINKAGLKTLLQD